MTTQRTEEVAVQMPLSLTEQRALDAYVEVARLEFVFGVALTRANSFQCEVFGTALDQAADRFVLARNAVDKEARVHSTMEGF